MEGMQMAALSANPKIARGLERLYAQMSDLPRGRTGALRERDFGLIDMGVEPTGNDGSAFRPAGDADLIKRLGQIFGTNTALPSKLWPTETLRQALASFLQGLKEENGAEA
jgi:hypothetical protein